jgi:hypothetical protein
MQDIEHKIVPIKQKPAECMQTAATQLLSFFNPSVLVEDVIKNVPVYVENGEKIGTSPGHLAAYLAQQGYKTTVYVFDVELFDLSWDGMPSSKIIELLKLRQAGIPTNSWLAKYHHILIDGWELFVNSGGTFTQPSLSTQLLRDLVNDHPFLMMVNSTYLNHTSKQQYNKAEDKFEDDFLNGRSLTHGVTCAGYKGGSFLIVDPDPPEGQDQHRWIKEDHLIASVMAAQTESDNLLIVIDKV